MRKLAVLIFSILLKINAFAGDGAVFFENGNRAFQSGNFAEAVKNYESAMQTGEHSANLHANLGHAYFKQKNWAKAILHYERARLLAPDDAALKNDLAIARKKARVEAPEEPSFVLFRWWKNLRESESASTWAWVSLVFAWLAAAAFWLIWKGQLPRNQQLAKVAATALTPLFLLTLALAWSSGKAIADSEHGIVCAPNTPVFSAPDANTIPLDSLAAGEKVGLPERLGEWWRVVAPTGEEGWMEVSKVEKI